MILASDEIQTLQKLESAAEDGRPIRLTEEDGIRLRNIIKIYAGLEALGLLGKGVRQVLLWAIGLYTAWKVFGGIVLDVFAKK